MKPLQVVVPMAGSGRRFRRAGIRTIKPLIPVGGKPVIARLLARFPKDSRFVFICRKDHLKNTRLRAVLKGLAPRAAIVGISPHRKGPVHSVLAGEGAIAGDAPTLVNYCDFDFEWNHEAFRRFARRTRCDGAIFCYTGFHPHFLAGAMYATCRVRGGRVLDIREKECFTKDRRGEWTSSGTYFFRSGTLMKDAFREAVRRGLAAEGEFYVSLAYRPLLEAGRNIRVFPIDTFLQWGTPEDLDDYLYWSRCLMAPRSLKTPRGPRLLMPMAGRGERFRREGLPAKPFVPVDGRPMFLNAARHLPAAGRPVFVAHASIASRVKRALPNAAVISLSRRPTGEALSVLAAETAFDPAKPVLVSSCDHGLIWNEARWENSLAGKPDLVVVGQRGFPGARLDPGQYAYIRTARGSGRVNGVSVKRPLGPAPQKDLVMVGTFYFREAGRMFGMIRSLARRGPRVNGELYLDSVVNLCVEAGWDVRCFEADGYLCWGTPDLVRTHAYWRRVFKRRAQK